MKELRAVLRLQQPKLQLSIPQQILRPATALFQVRIHRNNNLSLSILDTIPGKSHLSLGNSLPRQIQLTQTPHQDTQIKLV